jgi:WD40 repeat protein
MAEGRRITQLQPRPAMSPSTTCARITLAVLLALLAAPAGAQQKIAPEARTGEPWALSVSPDGRKLAAACGFHEAGGTLVVWDLVAGSKTVVAQPKRGLLTVAFSPDGTHLAAGGFDNVLWVYEVATGKVVHQLVPGMGFINGLAWSPDGTAIATVGQDKAVHLWDLKNGRERDTLEGHPERLLSVAFAPDGKWLVSSCKDGSLKVWDVDGRKELRTLAGHQTGVQCVAVSPDGKRIASGAWGQQTRIWNAADGTTLHALAGHSKGVFSVRFAPDGKTLVSTSGVYASPAAQGEIKFWDVETGKGRATWVGHVGGIWCAAFSPDGRTLFTGGADQTIKVWEVTTGQQRAVLITSLKADPPKAAPAKAELTAENLQRIGRQLYGKDARAAYAALHELVQAPASAVPWLRQQLPPDDAARRKQLRRWVAALDSDDPKERDEAARRLEEAGPAAVSLLHDVAENSALPELRQRAAELLKHLAPGGAVPEAVYLNRLVEALETIGNAEARAHLAVLAKGPADARLTREAQAALKRLSGLD